MRERLRRCHNQRDFETRGERHARIRQSVVSIPPGFHRGRSCRRSLGRGRAGGLRAGTGSHSAGHRRGAAGAESGRVADVAPDPRWLGLQPARSGQPRQRGRPPDGLVARPSAGPSAGDAASSRRRAVHAEPARHHSGDRRGHRRPDLGAPARPPGRSGRLHDWHVDRHEPQHRHPWRADNRHEHGRPHFRAERGDRRGSVGH